MALGCTEFGHPSWPGSKLVMIMCVDVLRIWVNQVFSMWGTMQT